jgi:hypothetical protein
MRDVASQRRARLAVTFLPSLDSMNGDGRARKCHRQPFVDLYLEDFREKVQVRGTRASQGLRCESGTGIARRGYLQHSACPFRLIPPEAGCL